MPDAWESARGLNPTNPADGPATAANGYTNLENYLNELAEDAAPPPQGRREGWCPIHQTAMRQTTKEGRSWFSHKVDGRWCKGK
jgi:hypothetical protein